MNWDGTIAALRDVPQLDIVFGPQFAVQRGPEFLQILLRYGSAARVDDAAAH